MSNYDDNDGGYNDTEKHNGGYNEDNDKALLLHLLQNYTVVWKWTFLVIVIIVAVFLLVDIEICNFLLYFKLG